MACLLAQRSSPPRGQQRQRRRPPPARCSLGSLQLPLRAHVGAWPRARPRGHLPRAADVPRRGGAPAAAWPATSSTATGRALSPLPCGAPPLDLRGLPRTGKHLCGGGGGPSAVRPFILPLPLSLRSAPRHDGRCVCSPRWRLLGVGPWPTGRPYGPAVPLPSSPLAAFPAPGRAAEAVGALPPPPVGVCRDGGILLLPLPHPLLPRPHPRLEPPPPPPRPAAAATRTVVVPGKFDAFHGGHLALVRAAAAFYGPEGPPVAITLVSFSGMAAALRWPPRATVVAPADIPPILRDWSRAVGAPVSLRILPFEAVRSLSPAAFLDFVVADPAAAAGRPTATATAATATTAAANGDGDGAGGGADGDGDGGPPPPASPVPGLAGLGASAVVCGEDWRFGHRAAADVDDLRSLAAARALGVGIVDKVPSCGGAISSTRVRAALGAGEVWLAGRLMGRPHRLWGQIVGAGGGGGAPPRSARLSTKCRRRALDAAASRAAAPPPPPPTPATGRRRRCRRRWTPPPHPPCGCGRAVAVAVRLAASPAAAAAALCVDGAAALPAAAAAAATIARVVAVWEARRAAAVGPPPTGTVGCRSGGWPPRPASPTVGSALGGEHGPGARRGARLAADDGRVAPPCRARPARAAAPACGWGHARPPRGRPARAHPRRRPWPPARPLRGGARGGGAAAGRPTRRRGGQRRRARGGRWAAAAAAPMGGRLAATRRAATPARGRPTGGGGGGGGGGSAGEGGGGVAPAAAAAASVHVAIAGAPPPPPTATGHARLWRTGWGRRGAAAAAAGAAAVGPARRRRNGGRAGAVGDASASRRRRAAARAVVPPPPSAGARRRGGGRGERRPRLLVALCALSNGSVLTCTSLHGTLDDAARS
ncbi:hypothetical protein BU14_0098s0030 [Porphyra umbilicalis]|uniref:Uncharacterized protein n=1 Tax=Porphyra umbilicalis TaxID=2786 RepID=A0A1X6PD95_PORUM|nr:hypothetical protein BU14_0098s0030 [Porphyra umbilicalis]|eukprot:OSX78804.1 hypothetical protein BU14_0098s0030 [Porphyra umbilicalis]